MKMSVVIESAAAERALRRAPREVSAEIARAINFITTDIANQAKADHPYIDRTGNLTNSIGIVPARAAIFGEISGSAQATMAYAEPVEFGVDGHSQPYPFMGPAFERWAGRIEEQIVRGANRGLRKAGFHS